MNNNKLALLFVWMGCLVLLLNSSAAVAALPALYVQTQKVTVSSAGSCGDAATLSGNGAVAIFGCPSTSSDKGIVYVYRANNQGTFGSAVSFQPTTDGNKARIGDSVAINAAGTVIAFGAPNAKTGNNDPFGVFYYSRYSGSSWAVPTKVTVTGSEGLGRRVAVSPDGTWIAAADDDSIYFYKLNTNVYEVSASSKRSVSSVYWMEFDNTGKFVYNNGFVTVVLGLNSNVWTQAQSLNTVLAKSSSISQDGKYIAVSFGGFGEDKVNVYKFSGSAFAFQQELDDIGYPGRVAFTKDSTRLLIASPAYNDMRGGFIAFDLVSNVWKQSSSEISGSTFFDSPIGQGAALGASSDGLRVIIGGPNDSVFKGSVWFFKDSTTSSPTSKPTSQAPSKAPSPSPTKKPTSQAPSKAPSPSPTHKPTSQAPSKAPTHAPSTSPTNEPTTQAPSPQPTYEPTSQSPSTAPTKEPTSQAPSSSPTSKPTSQSPSHAPTQAPSHAPTKKPTSQSPTLSPTTKPVSSSPSKSPVNSPTSHAPSSSPTSKPSSQTPTGSPNSSPTFPPSSVQFCKPQNGLNKAKCEARMKSCAKLGIPMKWGGAGCKVNNKPLGDGGCQCQSYCGYKCQTACNGDTRCKWQAGACFNKATGKQGEPMPICVV